MIISTFVTQHPIATMLFYILFCIGVGVGIYFTYSAIRKKIQIKNNMKRRVQSDQSNRMDK